jgi:hypothetical protein
MLRFVVMMIVGLPSVSWAACESQQKALDNAKGDAVAAAYTALATCDANKARDSFPAAMKKTTDVAALGALAKAAIEAGLDAQVLAMLDEITEYQAKEETARFIGGLCAESPKIQAFVVNLHDALKDRAFVGWAGAIRACQVDVLTEKLESLAAAPPPREFDDKYATVIDIYASKKRAAALPVLEKAANAAAAGGGPFLVIIDAMVKAVTPEGIGGKPTDADRDALVAALERVQTKSDAQIQKIANALVAVGAPDAAGKLLPKLYPDRVQSDGSFLYGVVSVEKCGEAAVVHWAVVEDPAKRWSIAEHVDGPAKAFKAKLKCKDPTPYTVQLTPEPVKNSGEVEAWAEQVASTAGEEAKLKAEKTVVLN